MKRYKICKRKGAEADCYNTNNPIKYLWVRFKIWSGMVKEWK